MAKKFCGAFLSELTYREFVIFKQNVEQINIAKSAVLKNGFSARKLVRVVALITRINIPFIGVLFDSQLTNETVPFGAFPVLPIICPDHHTSLIFALPQSVEQFIVRVAIMGSDPIQTIRILQ